METGEGVELLCTEERAGKEGFSEEVGPEEQGGFWCKGKKSLLGEGKTVGWPARPVGVGNTGYVGCVTRKGGGAGAGGPSQAERRGQGRTMGEF